MAETAKKIQQYKREAVAKLKENFSACPMEIFSSRAACSAAMRLMAPTNRAVTSRLQRRNGTTTVRTRPAYLRR